MMKPHTLSRASRTRSSLQFTIAITTLVSVVGLTGCAAVSLVSGMAQNSEYQKKIDVPAMYTNLANHKCAILVDMSMGMMYEHPYLAGQIALGVGNAIQKNIEGAEVLNPEQSLAWQYRTSSWNLLPYGDVAAALDVERVIVVDIYEFRYNPPGNRYEWEGVGAANIRIIEADPDSFDPDTPADEFSVIVRFPDDQAVLAYNTPKDKIEAGLLLKFTQQVAWLFYDHIQPKYPDKFRPELDS